MKILKTKAVFWAVFATALFLLMGGCSAIKTVSVMPHRQIAIDASDSEWQNWFYEKEKTGTKAAVCSDSDFVYICFTTRDVDILAQIVQGGFIVWFNSEGNKDKELGINYPFVARGEGPGGPPPEGGASRGGGAPPGGKHDSNFVSVSELKVLTTGNDEGAVLSLDDARALGITARINSDQSGKLVYELKMPLKTGNNRPYIVDVSPENVIGIGMMAGAEEGSSLSGISGFGGSMGDMGGSMGGGMGGGMGGDMGGGMGGDMGGGMGGGMGGDMGGGMSVTPSTFKIWARVTLTGF